MLYMNELDCGWASLLRLYAVRLVPGDIGRLQAVFDVQTMRGHLQVAKVPTPFPKDRKCLQGRCVDKNDIKADET